MKDMVFDFVMRMTGGNRAVAALCAQTVGALDEGDVCHPLDEAEAACLKEFPAAASFVTDDVSPDSVRTPFVVANGLLYTRRNWYYERLVRDRLTEMCQSTGEAETTLPDTPYYASLRDEQRQAVATMIRSRFSILTGGPGTGKTHTVARAVRLLRDQRPDLRLALAAPTGKAAARMVESMRKAMDNVPEARTIHSLLESNYDLVTFKHNRTNPLACDWLIVDEASMIDLPLMAKLLDALPAKCRLTLVGDADQLASVERGRVFGDLCRLPKVPIARLSESARFPPGGEIARLAAAVNGDQADEALSILRAGKELVAYTDLCNADPFRPQSWSGFTAAVKKGFADFAACRDAATALEHINDFRVLCALRQGPFGSERVGEYIKALLGDECPVPVMITQNDHMLGVSNGDVGVVMPGDGQYLHLPTEGGVRPPIRLELLPATELAFASTVHKSQGSEFTDVALMMPPNASSPLLTREILYTGITRTKKRVLLYAGEESVRRCCEKRVARVTGLGSVVG